MEKVIYPVIDEKRHILLETSTELVRYGQTDYYFSPHFKKSNEIIDGIIRGYISKKSKLQEVLTGSDLIIRDDFNKKKLKTKIDTFLKELKSKDKINVEYSDIIGYFKNGRFTVLLTCDCLYSDYGRDNYSGEDDPRGLYVKCLIKNVIISQHYKIVNDDETYEFEESFTDGFIEFLEELKELNKSIKSISNTHPLSTAKEEVRENYIAVLVDKALADGNFSANEVVRLEILSRQIGIRSLVLLNLIAESLNRFDKYKVSEQYILDSLKKMEKIPKEFHYMLYHDLVTFELLSNKGEIKEQSSDFSKVFAKKYGINSEFDKIYTEAIQKMVLSSYKLREIINSKSDLVNHKKAFSNLCDSIEYEYNLQKELLS